MGMYTGLAFRAQLSTFGVSIVEDFYKYLNTDDLDPWKEIYKNTGFFETYSSLDRSTFIPNGFVCYMPESKGWTVNVNVLNSNVWEVCCSLKNYEGEIECFLETVLPRLIDSDTLVKVQYEEDESPTYTTITSFSEENFSFHSRHGGYGASILRSLCLEIDNET